MAHEERSYSTSGTPVQKKRDEFFYQVRKIIAEVLEVEPDSIQPDAKLIEELGMDSMKALEILAAVEKRFRIKVPEENLLKMTTLNNVAQVARAHAPNA